MLVGPGIGSNGLWYVYTVFYISSVFHAFFQDRAKDSRIGVDARMIAHEIATLLSSKLNSRSSKLIFPPQNLVDFLWKDRPLRAKNPILVQGREFSGECIASLARVWISLEIKGKDATEKIREVREWIKAQPPAVPSYSKSPPTPAQMHVATLITSLSNIGMTRPP
jgi:Xaa-Pro aminopeptidase